MWPAGAVGGNLQQSPGVDPGCCPMTMAFRHHRPDQEPGRDAADSFRPSSARIAPRTENAAAATGCRPWYKMRSPRHMAVSQLGATWVDLITTAARLRATIDEVYQAPESWANEGHCRDRRDPPVRTIRRSLLMNWPLRPSTYERHGSEHTRTYDDYFWRRCLARTQASSRRSSAINPSPLSLTQSNAHGRARGQQTPVRASAMVYTSLQRSHMQGNEGQSHSAAARCLWQAMRRQASAALLT
jgi:hypothetical protein